MQSMRSRDEEYACVELSNIEAAKYAEQGKGRDQHRCQYKLKGTCEFHTTIIRMRMNNNMILTIQTANFYFIQSTVSNLLYQDGYLSISSNLVGAL